MRGKSKPEGDENEQDQDRCVSVASATGKDF